MAFIPLDSENLSKADENLFSYDYGDTMFPYFHGNFDNQLREKHFFKGLKSYIPNTLLRFPTETE